MARLPTPMMPRSWVGSAVADLGVDGVAGTQAVPGWPEAVM